MSLPELKDKAQTVLGPVDTAGLGVTITHEHLISDLSVWFMEPVKAGEKALAQQPVNLGNLGWLRYNATRNRDNLLLRDEEVAISEVRRYRQAGGKTIVEVTNIGFGRNPLALKRIAQATGTNIIMGSGYYIGPCHPPGLSSLTEAEIAESIVRDITSGADDTEVCAGIIGELGCSYPLQEGERKVLRASALAQRHTGAPVNIHPAYPYKGSPFEVVSIFKEAGGDLERTVLSHIDNFFFDTGEIERLAKSGCYLEFDLFGRFGRMAHPREFIDFPSDGERIEMIKKLIGLGSLDRILISHDICLKMRLTQYGGHGYAHILDYVVPLMRTKGITEESISTILVDNPKRMLQFA